MPTETSSADLEKELQALQQLAQQSGAEELLAHVARVRSLALQQAERSSQLAREVKELSGTCNALEREHARLASIHAATQRLQESHDGHDTLDAIQEILGNLIGCEAFAVFEVADNNELQLLRAVGVETEELVRHRLIGGQVGRVAQEGTTWVSPEGRPAPPDDIAACIPLIVGARVLGVIVLFKLVGHKAALSPIDRELFEVLAMRAGAAPFTHPPTSA